MNIVLDTNRLSDALLGHTNAVRVVESATRIFVPFIVLGELHFGFYNGGKRAENERRLSRFLAKPGVTALLPMPGRR